MAPEDESKALSSTTNNGKDTTFAMIIMVGLLGSSMGFSLYTRRTARILKQFERVAKNKEMRMPPTRIGPDNKKEWDKKKSRWEDDDW
jgi:hypothetical protein